MIKETSKYKNFTVLFTSRVSALTVCAAELLLRKLRWNCVNWYNNNSNMCHPRFYLEISPFFLRFYERSRHLSHPENYSVIERSYKIHRIAPKVSRGPLTAINRDQKILADKFTDPLFAFERQLSTENKRLKEGSDSSDH